MEELKIRDKVEINHPAFGKPLIGVVFNINDYRPPEAKYAVDVDGFEHQKNYWVPEFGWIEHLKQEELKDNLKVWTVKRRGN